MIIKTEFDIGDIVYIKGSYDSEPMKIVGVRYLASEIEYEVISTKWPLFVKDYPISCLTKDRKELKTVYDLNEGDEYFCIANGWVEQRVFSNSKVDRQILESGSGFKSQERAEEKLKRRQIHERLRVLSYNYEFDPDGRNWSICFDHDTGELYSRLSESIEQVGTVYFESSEDAEKAIAEVGEDVLMEKYFGIRC